jgi:hypothetical protein
MPRRQRRLRSHALYGTSSHEKIPAHDFNRGPQIPANGSAFRCAVKGKNIAHGFNRGYPTSLLPRTVSTVFSGAMNGKNPRPPFQSCISKTNQYTNIATHPAALNHNPSVSLVGNADTLICQAFQWFPVSNHTWVFCLPSSLRFIP